MKTRPWLMAAVFLACVSVLFSAQGAPNGATIRWHPIENGGLPQSLVLNPAKPTITNIISFVAPTDGQIYVNECFASVANGVPMIAVDALFQKVDVSFSPQTNRACPLIALPVIGVEGEFGPLRAGAWTFNILSNAYAFEVTYVPMLLSVQALASSPLLQISWLNSGEWFSWNPAGTLRRAIGWPSPTRR